MTLPNWTHRTSKAALAAFQRLPHWGRNVVRFVWARRGWLVLLVLVVATGVGIWAGINNWDWLSTTFWDWLRGGLGGIESGSTTVRNLGLIIAGVIALPLAIWRSSVAQRQASTAQQSLLNERYQQGAEMLGSDVLAVRLGGIYALSQLTREYPKQYHVQIMKLLCAFVRHPTKDERGEAKSETEKKPQLREDVHTAMVAISAYHKRHLQLEKDEEFRLYLANAVLSGVFLDGSNLAGANLAGADLSGETVLVRTDLSKANLSGANLADANLIGANLSGAHLTSATLAGTKLTGANLSCAFLWHANLSGTELSTGNDTFAAIGLTQNELDTACADPDAPPKLDGVLDAETGKPLVWRGKPLDN